MKRIIKLLGLMIMALLVSSCNEDMLDIAPYGVVDGNVLANRQGIDQLLIGCYATLDGKASEDNYVWNNFWASDDARMGSNAGVSAFDAFLIDPTYGEIATRWKTLYGFINRCNSVLEVLPKATDMSDTEKAVAAAQARFIRAYTYFWLAVIWKNVPWIDETISYGEKNYFVSNMATDIYGKIEEDLIYAADYLPETWSEVGRINKWAAKCMLAKTYMFQKKFSEAKTILDDVIANGKTSKGLKYQLLPKYRDNFRTATKNGSEAVFEVQMAVNDGTSNGVNGNPMSFQNGTYDGLANKGYGWYQPTFDLVDAFQTDETTGLPLLDNYYETPIKNDYGIASTTRFTPYTGTLDPRLDWCVGRRGLPYLDWGNHPGKSWIRNQNNGGPYSSIKHAAEKATVSSDRQGTNYTNVPYDAIRFADVLLWAAECEVEVGSLEKAEEYVNLIRQRASNPDGFVRKYSNGTFLSSYAANYKIGLYTGQFAANGKSYARKAVRFERRLELAMEHHRYFDLLRYDGNDFDLESYMDTFMKREGARLTNSPNNLYLQGDFVRGKNELYPIPQVEIDRSIRPDGTLALVQNPGYD
ncbi:MULTISPECIES: RagB/SusD family nutrient uptake outer membrane protein [unclassified Prevotella]|uniref:RagB/SusD family nutrient uptake outer membrane protein n=1 Tax=unclassified Prevotella TaxID=2638335 RepID=UPI0008B2C463|nr:MULTISPECIES: RagB/SusD family nutrient uptake outer membrane protein [unclassified Prevotella]SES68080.1 Starch-binding associating with outer membrane [Prevotella sp. kh1p2]SFF81675.1 Starch-binding associating with outer membrane [Prevotella sp. KH2C16]SNU10256.1 Starch-binding associating with outer membrane [Prevotellaceae bacterium KH2P17]